MLRIVTIGIYLKKIGSEYEKFVFFTRGKGANPYIFEYTALFGSSFVFNLALSMIHFTGAKDDLTFHTHFLLGTVGMIITIFSLFLYKRRVREISELAETYGLKQNQ